MHYHNAFPYWWAFSSAPWFCSLYSLMETARLWYSLFCVLSGSHLQQQNKSIDLQCLLLKVKHLNSKVLLSLSPLSSKILIVYHGQPVLIVNNQTTPFGTSVELYSYQAFRILTDYIYFEIHVFEIHVFVLDCCPI